MTAVDDEQAKPFARQRKIAHVAGMDHDPAQANRSGDKFLPAPSYDKNWLGGITACRAVFRTTSMPA
jgi:hypothetical protein